MSRFKKILCPTDFSEASYEALRQAVELAADGVTEICVLHVEPPVDELTAFTGLATDTYAEAEHRAETVRNLCAVLEERVPQSVRTRPLLKKGQAAEEIARAAREEGADLIVLTTHGAGGLEPGELGGVAAAVVQTAPCPVLTINRTPGTVGAQRAAAPEIAGLRPQFDFAHSSPRAIYLDGD